MHYCRIPRPKAMRVRRICKRKSAKYQRNSLTKFDLQWLFEADGVSIGFFCFEVVMNLGENLQCIVINRDLSPSNYFCFPANLRFIMAMTLPGVCLRTLDSGKATFGVCQRPDETS